MAAISIDPGVYQQHVTNVNEALGAARQSAKVLFGAFKSAYEQMHDLHPADWRRFRKEIRCDESTLNKMTKIVRSTFVMSNLDQLPNAWSTLYRIALISEDDAPSLTDALREGTLTQKSRLCDVLKLVPSQTKHQNSKPFIRFSLGDIDPELVRRLIAVVEELRDAGVVCKDVGKRSAATELEEPESEIQTKKAA